MPPVMQKGLEKEYKDQATLNKLRREHTKQLLKELTVIEDIEKRNAKLKQAVQDQKKVYDAVSNALAGTTKNAEQYGKAIKKDIEAVNAFAAQHKISLENAIEMYKKVKDEQKSFWQQNKDQIKQAVTGALTAVTVTAAYNKRVEEIIEGQRLFATSVSMTSANFKETAKYVEGYRYAMRNARDITKEFGVDIGEAEGTLKAVAYSMRNVAEGSDDLGKRTIKTTRTLYGMSRMLGIDVADALAAYRDEMMVHGKTSEDALKSLDTMTTAYDVMSKSVDKSVLPFKEDFFGALRDVKQELGPVSVNTLALNAAMIRMAEGASKAGLSTQSVTDSMKALPKMLKGIPAYYQQTIGRGFINKMQTDFDPKNPAINNFLTSLPKGLQKQMKTIQGMNVPGFMKNQMAYDVMIGSDKGISAVIKTMQGIDPARRLAMLQQMGLSTQDILATNDLFAKGELSTKEIAKVKEKITQGQKKTVDIRERLNETMDKNMNMVDRGTKATRDAIETMLKLKDTNIDLIAGVGSLTVLLQSQMFQSIAKGLMNFGKGGGLGGGAAGGAGGAVGLGAQSLGTIAKGGLGGIVAGAAGVLAAGAIGYSIGTYIDKAFGISDKLSDWMSKGEKEESKKRVKAHEQNITLKNAEDQAKMYAKLSETMKVIEVSGKGGVKEKRALTRGMAENRIANWLKAQGKTGEEQKKIMEGLASHLNKIPTKDELKERQQVGAALTPEKEIPGRIRAEAALAGGKSVAAGDAGALKKPGKVDYDPAAKQVTFSLADLAGPFQELQNMSQAQNPKSR